MPRQTWIADAARDEGLAVIEVDGWLTRGKDSFNPGGVVCHHTAGAATGDIPSLRVLIEGRADLPGPLCNWGLSRAGVVYVIAAGRANHAGAGGWKGMVGNSSVLGIEAENRGGPGDPWPARQLEAYHALCAAAHKHLGRPVDYTCGHKEWAPSRKVDPHTLSMAEFRRAVAEIIEGKEDEFMALFKDRKEFDAAVGELVASQLTQYLGGSAAKNTAITLKHPDTGEKRIFEVDMLVETIGEQLVPDFVVQLWARFGHQARLVK